MVKKLFLWAIVLFPCIFSLIHCGSVTPATPDFQTAKMVPHEQHKVSATYSAGISTGEDMDFLFSNIALYYTAGYRGNLFILPCNLDVDSRLKLEVNLPGQDPSEYFSIYIGGTSKISVVKDIFALGSSIGFHSNKYDIFHPQYNPLIIFLTLKPLSIIDLNLTSGISILSDETAPDGVAFSLAVNGNIGITTGKIILRPEAGFVYNLNGVEELHFTRLGIALSVLF